MNFLNAQQLAFILDIKKEDARAKMCAAWEKVKGIPRDTNDLNFQQLHGAKRNIRKKIEDPYPKAMPIDVLSSGLNLPSLESMYVDIRDNFLKRPSSKKWILADFPEKVIKKAEQDCKVFPVSIAIPPALKSLLPVDAHKEIYNYWSAFRTADNMTPRFRIEGKKEAFGNG